MKRRADLDGDEGGRYKIQADPSPATEGGDGMIRGRGRRHAAYLRKVRQLNSQFTAWVKTRVAPGLPPLPLSSAVTDYIKYANDLKNEYADALQEDTSGSLLVWGTGDMGQLGLGEDVSEKSRPFPLSLGQLPVMTIACGGMHSLAVTQDGKVWSWGVNDEGALGRQVTSSNTHLSGQAAAPSGGLPDNEPGPVTEGLPAMDPVVAVSAGDSHSVALTKGGDVYAWGTFRDASGLWKFDPSTKICSKPALVLRKSAAGSAVVQIASGADHVLARTSAGQVFSWGCGERGRLGRLAEDQCDGRKNAGSECPKLLTPAPITDGLKGASIVSVGCCAFSSFAIAKDGKVYGWGMNNYGQLGWEVPTEKGRAGDGFYAPREITSLSHKGVACIKGGEHHAIALTSSGEVLSFGRPTYGRLGRSDVDTNSDEPYHEPRPVLGMEGKAVGVAAGVSISAAVTEKGSVYVWGYGDTCQLGKGKDEEDELLPVLMKSNKFFSGNTVTEIAFGGQHAAMIAKE